MSTALPAVPAAPVAEIPFELYNRHVYVEARIGGSGPLAFVFDTGAPATVVDLDRARELGVALGGAFQAAGAGGDGLRTGAFVLSTALALPGLVGVELPITYAVELAGLHGREGRRIDGILAWDVAGESLLEIDYPARRLRFHDRAAGAPAGGETLPMTIRHGHPHVAATLVTAAGDEVVADCVVDVGSSLGLIATRPFAESHDLLRGAPRTVEDSCGAGISGSSRARYGRLASLRLGQIEIPGVVAACSLDERGVFATSQYFEANLGGEILCRYRIVLDFGRGLLTLLPGPEAGAPFGFDASGLDLGAVLPDLTRVEVLAVAPGSPAERAGLRAGDAIVGLDGEADPALEAVRERLQRGAGSEGEARLAVARGADRWEVHLPLASGI